MDEPGAVPYIEEARLLLELSRDVSSSLDLQEVLDKSLRALRKLIDFGGGSIQLIFEGALQLVAADPHAPPDVYRFRLPLGEGFGGRVAVTGEPIYSADATVDPRAHPEGRAKASTAGVRSYFAAPMMRSGTPVGIVQFDSTTVDAFPPRAQALVLAFIPTITAAVQNAQLFEREIDTLNELREAERLKNDFLAVVSHELRTPLASVLGLSETLANRVSDMPPHLVVDFAARILSAGKRLGVLIEDILDVSTLERGVLRVAPGPVPVRELLSSFKRNAATDRHTIVVRVDPDVPPVHADPGRLLQVMQNLVDNAQKFSPPGTTITIRARREGERVAISVTDEGRGIPVELRDRVFQRFFQAEPASTRTTGGLGIGLYLVRTLCELMGGEVRLESGAEAGSTFTVLLPAGAANAHPAPAT